MRTHFLDGFQAYLFPGIVQHNSTTNRNSRLILHERVERLLMIVAPLVKERTSVKQHRRKLFEWKWWELGILFSYKIFVEPVSNLLRDENAGGKQSERGSTHACSTWKHIRSKEDNSSSGRLSMKRLSRCQQLGCFSKLVLTDLERSSRTSSWLASL